MAAQGPSIVTLAGLRPGVLDKSQPSRVLRHPNSTLSFASFDPYIATSNDLSKISKLSLDDEQCRPKRIVIETVPGYGSFWRWVPSARKQEGVENEGLFPRVIDVCGQLCNCSLEQWELYKLDPFYDCLVKHAPSLTTITLASSLGYEPPDPQPIPADPIYEDDDDGYEKMMVDDDNMYAPSASRLRKRKTSPRVSAQFEFPNNQPINGGDPNQKRRAGVSFQSLRPEDEEVNAYLEDDSQNRNTKTYMAKNQKRARTLSPGAQKRAGMASRSKHENRKQARWREETEARRTHRDINFMREVYSDVPPTFTGTNGMHDIPEEFTSEDPEQDYTESNGARSQSHPAPEPAPEAEDPLEESRRKMAELNSDRHKQREREMSLRPEHEASSSRPKNQHQHAEAERRRRENEELARKEEEARKLEEQERLQRQEEQRRRAAMLEQVGRERELRHAQWNKGRWTTSRAIERYKVISAFFDKARYSDHSFPLTFIDVPWPTLRHPNRNRAQDMDWQATNEFCNSLKPVLRGQAFKDFLKQSLQRFHPDRWRSRNLFTAVLDEEERNEIHTAVNSVSKALGALYADAKSN